MNGEMIKAKSLATLEGLIDKNIELFCPNDFALNFSSVGLFLSVGRFYPLGIKN